MFPHSRIALLLLLLFLVANPRPVFASADDGAADSSSDSSSLLPSVPDGIAQVPTTLSKASRTSDTVASYFTGAITKPSPGRFSYWNEQVWQSAGTGWGRAAEYRLRLRGENYGGLLFSDTPTNGTLYVPGQKPFSWPVHRYEFDVLWTHQFVLATRRAIPYVTSGAGAIALNGGSGPTGSGWDRQAALVAGAGSDVRLSRLVTLRAGFTVDSIKAPTYCDQTYTSSRTVMVEPHIGVVWNLGMPHPQ